ncbi:hypothetical protein Jiend_56040 [Micromonospora endophytica]|nr:hypothetical protein Jiend_56040 [Micromonospora endophytica]
MGLAVFVVLGVGVGAFAWALPTVAATACPQCYGLSDRGGRLYADSDEARYRQLLDEADRRITAFYGERTSTPRVLICTTAECYRRIGGGGEKGRAIRNWSLMLSPAGANVTIATHELSHVEFHERLGSASGSVPDWFDEGLAVLVSDDARYLKPAGEPDRCLVPYEQALPIVDADWGDATHGGVDRPYLLAACVVSRWTAANGGSAAVLDAIAQLRAGADFPAVVSVPR